MAEASWLAEVSWLLAWANISMESLKNDHFFLLFYFVSGTKKQSSKPTKQWMNLSYLNKKISKCTIYMKQLDLREVYKKAITEER